jgi:hypothetical protein
MGMMSLASPRSGTSLLRTILKRCLEAQRLFECSHGETLRALRYGGPARGALAGANA